MANFGLYSEENARAIAAMYKYLRDNGFTIQPPGRGQRNLPSPEYIYIRNDSGAEVPPYGCVQTTGTVEFGGQNYITVEKPADVTGAAGWFLFNGPAAIPIDEYGVAQSGQMVRMLTDGSSIVCGEAWQPTVNSFEVQLGGSAFVAIGADDIATDVMKGFVIDPTEQPSIIHFKSKGGGIAAISGSTMGSASCDKYTSSTGGVLSDSGVDVTIYNTAAAFAANKFGIAAKNSAGLWVAIVEQC